MSAMKFFKIVDTSERGYLTSTGIAVAREIVQQGLSPGSAVGALLDTAL